ncbi:MAG: YggT family protein [Candidatus Pacebacteria bacterium]|nr:YggT family protein [Candidatus Paceibacterota bacterium]
MNTGLLMTVIGINNSNITVMESYKASSTKPLYRGTQVVWYILGFIEIMLAFRFVLKLLGANPEAGFTSLIYGITYVFATPFLSVFQNTQITTGSVFEWTTILAGFVYFVIGIGIIKMFLMSKSVSTPEAAAKLDEQETQ